MATVTLNQGKLRGGKAVSDKGTTYYEFLGVPYAKPPVGNLRFKSPQPLEPWIGERDATTVPQDNVCCQMEVMKGTTVGSEDCLYLNVYTPKLPESNSKLLPVMVFIHGGGFLYTNGIIKQDMGPDYLIDEDVIVITFNYRLGVLGFLSLGVPEATGNMGLKDQIFVLKWVQENIDKFGGDRDNVTLFGLSAGSASVEYLLISPLSKGLFHKVILQSGSSLNHWSLNYEPNKLVLKLLEKMGYSGSTYNNREIYEYLLASPASLLIEASNKAIEDVTNRMYFGFVPTIEKDFGNDEAVITDCPYKLLIQGKFNRVPVIKGFCNNEGYLMNLLKPRAVLDLMKNKNFTDHFSFLMDESDKSYFNAEILNAYSESIQPNDDKDRLAVNFYSDLDFVAGVWLSGQIIASHGLPVYFYEFSYEGNINFCKKLFGLIRKGAAHGDDFTYAFKHCRISQFCEGRDEEIRKNVCLILTGFAKTSIPDSGLDVEWPKYTNETPAYLSIDQDISIKYNFKPKKMAVFEEIYSKYLK